MYGDLTICCVDAITKRYGGATVLDAVGFSVQGGSIFGLLGPNGAGKSTCLHVLAGLVEPDLGAVRIGGVRACEPAAKLRLGFAPDDLPLPSALTGREYLAFHDRMRQRRDMAIALRLLEAFDIADAADRQIGDYSHGMKRKLQLAAALMHEPDLLVLDEPFRGLDPDAIAVLVHTLELLRRNQKSVLLATHDLARAQDLCDRVAILDRARIVGKGEICTLVSECGRGVSLEIAFLVLTDREAATNRKRQLVTESLRGISRG